MGVLGARVHKLEEAGYRVVLALSFAFNLLWGTRSEYISDDWSHGYV